MQLLKEKQLLTELDRFLESVVRANKNRAMAEGIRNIEKACQLYFKKQGRLFLKRFETFRNRFSESISSEEIRRILQQIQPYIEKGLKVELITNQDIVMARAAGQSFDGLGFAGMDVDFALANPRVVGFLERHAAELVTNIDETTRSQIATIVTKGVEEGQSYDKVARGIKNKFSQFAVGKPQLHIKSRAHLVAVTENRMAYEAGNMEAAQFVKKQGLTMEKAWMDSGDARVSDGCLDNSAAGWIDIDEAFPSGDDTSPRFPGCRCDILYRRKEAEPILESELYKAEENIAHNDYETVHIFDENGNQLLKKAGSSNEVGFTPGEALAIKGNILTHNHPSRSSFSRQDLRFAVTNDLKEIRAITPTRIYSAKPIKGKWPELKNIDNKATDIITETRTKWAKEIVMGRMTELEAEELFNDYIIKQLCKETGINYTIKEGWLYV